MATSCAENTMMEVFENSLDDVYSSSVDSPSTCTTKTSHCSSSSLIQTNSQKLDDVNSSRVDLESDRNIDGDQEDEDRHVAKRCTRSSSLRTAATKSSKRSSQSGGSIAPADDVGSNLMSPSSDGGDSQTSDGAIRNALQYAAQKASSKDKSKDVVVCQWFDCSKEVNFGELLDHLSNEHIKTQLKKKSGKEKATYVCRWAGCKVYGKPSTLHSWLERHVVCHLGRKPFRCIVDHCGKRFSSQFMLNRHINGHFPKQKSAKPKKELVAAMKFQKVSDRKKHPDKHPRPTSSASRDFCDSVTMSCIQRYITNFCQRTQVVSNSSGQFITFHGIIVGKRTDFSGAKSCLVRWLPTNVLPDEWIPEHQVPSKLTQVLPLSSVSGDIIKLLMHDW